MRYFPYVILFLLGPAAAKAQSLHVGVSGGLAQYQGDLVHKVFVAQNAKAALGVHAWYELTRHWTLRGGYVYAKLAGNDKYNATKLQARNFNFYTALSEVSVVGEYATFNLDERRATPYLFGGLALFHFDPYTYSGLDEKLYLKPLGTEGQGIAGYAAKPYTRMQLALPFGAGFRYAVSDNVRIGLELGFRKLFTDYLDDVSGSYAAASDLLQARGETAVAYAYRADELPGGDPAYPQKGAQRGGSTQKDYYYTAGFTLSFQLGGRQAASFSGGSKKRGYGCPQSPL